MERPTQFEAVKGAILARLLGVSEVTVSALARRGLVVKAGRRGFDLEASVRGYCQHLREQASGRKQGDTPQTERARLAKVQADSVELRNAIRRGSLVEAEAVAMEWEGICRTVRAGMLRVPKRAAAHLPHLTAQDVRELDAAIRDALSELGGTSGEGGKT